MSGRFIKVKCAACGNEQVIYGNSTKPVKCNVCGVQLSKPSGGRAVIINVSFKEVVPTV
ncbi:30S ribosomal protein S27e [Candidatus Micrarchaeota archaeon]|jgi:small subunit ribosomal protein S27e|nr:30S ribosomal protein S27e [Candidatus Micrarchaeota archaeon]